MNMSCLESAWGCIKGSRETKGLLFHQALVREDREESVGSRRRNGEGGKDDLHFAQC